MPERVGEEGSRRVPRQVFKVSTPPSHPRTPAGDTTEHGKMGRKLLMLSATPNCSPAEPEYIYTEIRPYAAGRRLAAHCRPGRFGSGDDWRCAEQLPPIQVPGRTKTGSPKRKGGAQGTEVRQAADKGCGRKAPCPGRCRGPILHCSMSGWLPAKPAPAALGKVREGLCRQSYGDSGEVVCLL